MREKYESLSVAVLRDLAKSRGIAKVSTMKKAELIELMLKEDEKEKKYMETHCAGRASGYQNEIQTGQAENV